MGITRSWARGNTKNLGHLTGDSGRHMDSAGMAYAVLNDGGFIVDAARVLSHPGFAQVDGVGIYTYPFNPDDTLNFVLAPARKIDSVIQRTLSSSIVVQQPEVAEDVLVTEVWTGGDKLSVLAEMFRVFYEFWLTVPEIGESLTWEPRDLTNESYQVQIVDVQLGPNDLRYRPIRERESTLEGAYLSETLTVKYKIVRDFEPPQSVITLAGI